MLFIGGLSQAIFGYILVIDTCEERLRILHLCCFGVFVGWVYGVLSFHCLPVFLRGSEILHEPVQRRCRYWLVGGLSVIHVLDEHNWVFWVPVAFAQGRVLQLGISKDVESVKGDAASRRRHCLGLGQTGGPLRCRRK